MKEKSDNWIFILGIVAIVCLVVVGIVADVVVKQSHEKFKREHNCKKVAKTSGTTGFGVDSGGKTSTYYVSGKTSYLCDDGVVYTWSE